MPAKDVSNLLERLEAFEDRYNVRLEALSAYMDGDDGDRIDVYVRGELHPKSGVSLESDIELVVSYYDSKDRVIQTGSEHFYKETFFGFEVFEIYNSLDSKAIRRIRLFPKLR